MNTRPARRVSVRIPPEIHEELEAIAFARGDGVTATLRRAIERDLRDPATQDVVQTVLRARAARQERAMSTEFSGAAVFGPDGQALQATDRDFHRLETTVRAVSDGVLRQLTDSPHLLRDLHWRDFEQLVAELFTRDGFAVQLMPATGDGGVDLYAARHTGLGSLLYVVQCKQWAEHRPVGPDVVLALKGALDRDRASAGILATTSYFTPGAKAEQRRLKWRVSLQGAEDLERWLRGGAIFDSPEQMG